MAIEKVQDNRQIQAAIIDWNWTMVVAHRLFPEVRGVLKSLQKMDIKVAVVSAGNDPDQKRANFERLKLGEYISIFHVVESGARKDFQPVLDQLGVEAQRCIVVGDRVERELREGKIAGCSKLVWVRRGPYSNEIPTSPEEVPDYLVPDLSLLPHIIRGLNSNNRGMR